MKKVFRNNRLVALALLTVFSLSAASEMQANETKPVIPVELKYVGTVKDHAIFELNYFGDNAENDVRVTILDVYGNPLFTENIKAVAFSKRFLLNKDEIIETPMRLEIVSRKSKEKVVFEINRNMRFVEEMVINTRQ